MFFVEVLWMHKMCFYVNLNCKETNCGERFGSFLTFFY